MTSYPQAAEVYREAVRRMQQAPDINHGLRVAGRLLMTLAREDLMSTALWREHEQLLPDRFQWGNLEPGEARAKAVCIERLAARLADGAEPADKAKPREP